MTGSTPCRCSLWCCCAYGVTVTLLVAALWVLSGFSNARASFEADESARTALMPVERETLVVYCGRGQSLVGDILKRFEDETGITLEVKYADTGPLATLILEEGRRSPADVFFAQDPGGLGLLAERGVLASLPATLLDSVDPVYRGQSGGWIGITGRARTVAWSTARLKTADLPASVLDLTDPKYRGRVGWAPTNASFQAFITALRHELGEAAAEKWLRDMLANGVRVYPRNTPIIQAIADGEIDLGLVNHYYLPRFIDQHGPDFPVANMVPKGRDGNGDIGGTMLVAGVGILKTARNPENAQRFIEFLLSEQTQRAFMESSHEYPLRRGMESETVIAASDLRHLQHIDLQHLADLRATIDLLRETRVLP